LDIKILENKKNIILEKVLKLMLMRFIINFGTVNLLSFLRIFRKKLRKNMKNQNAQNLILINEDESREQC